MTLRVAYVVDEWVTLSQTFIREEVRELRRQGVDVTLLAIRRGELEPAADEPATYLSGGHAGAAARLAAAARHPVLLARLLRAQVRMRPERVVERLALPEVAAELRRRQVGWVHAHFGWDASGVAEALAAMVGVGWSFTAHAHDIFVTNEHLPGKLARADRLVTVCRYNVDELRAAHPRLPPTEIVVCGVAVPPEVRTDKAIDVVAVGRLVPKKGFDVLLRACAALVVTRPDLRVEVIGEGPEREALEALGASLGVDRNVVFRGSLPHEEALDRVAAARVACLPARIAGDGDRDSMPVVIKEAMARAVPVVASAVVAVPEMVDDEVGRLVPPDDPAALAAALDEVLGDEALAARLGRAGRARVVERFTLAGEVGRLRDLFEGWSSR